MKYDLFRVLLLLTVTARLVPLCHADDNVPEAGEMVAILTNALPYYLYLPDDYDANSNDYPMLLFLHGSGESGTDLTPVAKHGSPRHIERGTDYPFVMIAPQSPSSASWSNSINVVKSIMDYESDRHRVDTNRICVTGLSMGGIGLYRFVHQFPDYFSAAAPNTGYAEWPVGQAATVSQLPFWGSHGDNDFAVPISNQQATMAELWEAGAYARFTIFPGVGHVSWPQIYANPKLYDWLLAQEKGTPPNYDVTVIAGSGTGFYEPESNIVISANDPPGGMEFVGWSGVIGATFGDESVTNITLTSTNLDFGAFGDTNLATTTFITPSNDFIVTANFVPMADAYLLTVSNGSAGADFFVAGSTVPIVATIPGAAFVFSHWVSPSPGVLFASADHMVTSFIMPSNPVSATAIFAPDPDYLDPYVIAINSGGGAHTNADDVVYVPDQLFAGGTTASFGSPIAGTPDDILYQSERWGDFTYEIPVSNDRYKVTLQFAEIFFSCDSCRVFSCLAESNTLFSGLDIHALVGDNVSLDLVYPVDVSDGALTLEFISEVDSAKLSALRIDLLSEADNYTAWRFERFGDSTSPSGNPEEDPDLDGMNNEDEWIAQTDPLDSNSVFMVAIASNATNGSHRLEFPAAGNRFYDVLFKSKLVDGSWINLLTNLALPTGLQSVTVSNGVHAAGAFRVNAVRP